MIGEPRVIIQVSMRLFDGQRALAGANLRGRTKTADICTLVNMGQGRVAIGRSNDAFMEAQGLRTVMPEISRRRGLVTYALSDIFSRGGMKKYRRDLADPEWKSIMVDFRSLHPRILAELSKNDAGKR